MRKVSLIVALAAGATSLAMAQAQDPGPTGNPKDNPTEMRVAADKGTSDPATFVKKAALGGMTEVEVAKLAESKGQDAKVKAFAQRMVKDHDKANQELATLASAKGWQVPTSLDAEHKAVVEKLNAKSGAEFDAAYSQQMMADHDKTIALFEGGSRASDAELAAWAKATLPTLKEHKQLAHALPVVSHSASAR